MKLADWPGVSPFGPLLGALEVGWLFTTRTLVRVMLPELLTVPLKTSGWPGCTGVDGQVLVTAMAGLFVPGQLAKAMLGTEWPRHVSLAVAVRVSRYGPHESSGTV